MNTQRALHFGNPKQIQRRLTLNLIMLAPPICLLSGCIGVLPLPSFSTKPECGEKLSAARVAFVKPGITTKVEVIRMLGTNFTSLPQDRAVAYTWEIPGGDGLWFFVIPGGSGAAGEFDWSRWRGFFVAFDNRGVVTATAFKRLSSRRSLDEQMDRWLVKSNSRIRKAADSPNPDFSAIQTVR